MGRGPGPCDKLSLDKRPFVWYIITMKDKKETIDFIVTTTNGTRWGTTAASFAQVRREFFGRSFGKGWTGMEIQSIERGKLFTDEESEQLRKEKLEHSCR